jgi:tRNA-dihydrouridine synthase
MFTNLKNDFPNEEIIINGGITTVVQTKSHLEKKQME